MESTKTGNLPESLIKQMINNKFLLLAVALGVGAAAYFGIGLFLLLRH